MNRHRRAAACLPPSACRRLRAAVCVPPSACRRLRAAACLLLYLLPDLLPLGLTIAERLSLFPTQSVVSDPQHAAGEPASGSDRLSALVRREGDTR